MALWGCLVCKMLATCVDLVESLDKINENSLCSSKFSEDIMDATEIRAHYLNLLLYLRILLFQRNKCKYKANIKGCFLYQVP